MTTKNQNENMPSWHDSAATQLKAEQSRVVVNWLGNLASKVCSPIRQRFEDRMDYNLSMPTHKSTETDIEEFERIHIIPRGIINVQATDPISHPQTSVSESDVA